MTRSVEEREIRVKSDRPRTFLLTLRTPAYMMRLAIAIILIIEACLLQAFFNPHS